MSSAKWWPFCLRLNVLSARRRLSTQERHKMLKLHWLFLTMILAHVPNHYSDVIMSLIVSHITSLTIVHSTPWSKGVDKVLYYTWIILCMCPAIKRRSYNIVMSSLIGWVHTLNDPWEANQLASQGRLFSEFCDTSCFLTICSDQLAIIQNDC